MTDRTEPSDELLAPEVMFVPLAFAVGEPWAELDRATWARRLPDFLHQVLNQGRAGPTAMLELQTATGDGPVTWVHVDAVPERDDAFALMPDGLDVRAVVTGEVSAADGSLQIEFCVHRDESDEEFVTAKVAGLVPLADPVPGLLRLARHLARLLDLRWDEPSAALLTRNGEAFRLFLRGLDGAMLLSGELEVAIPDDREGLLAPFAEALALDPNFGLALRVANASTAVALQGAQVDHDLVRRFLDRCYEAQPVDGEGCVAIAEQLAIMGEDARAVAWLEHATHLEPPPPRGLESLGLLLARRGEGGRARGLWQRGLDLDGHPDFYSHLAQLSFAEGRPDDGWDLTRRGLRHLRERVQRASEWDDADQSASVLLECLHAQLGRRDAPPAIVEALLALRSLLVGEERILLGACLMACGKRRDARAELVAGLRNTIDLDVRDQGVRALLNLDVADFELRFARASERALRGRNPRASIAEFQLWLHLQPEFWPALYFSALAKSRLRQVDESLDLLQAALEVAPGQPDVLFALAEGFAARANPKRALELIDEALAARSDEPRFVAARVRYLQRLDRRDAAREALGAARSAGLDSRELRRLARRLGRT